MKLNMSISVFASHYTEGVISNKENILFLRLKYFFKMLNTKQQT